ncbi:MAG TPA: DUF47 family protein [Nakamurella sp.]|jgi:uncharacterized protein Yka (UPF0111/DUF47 family)|nr:DUF47 family protein [Nakamurella sp.]
MPKLKPKEKAYYAHFATAAHAAASAAEIVAGLGRKSTDRSGAAEQLSALARLADDEYQSVLDALHASFVTPFDRTEIQALSRGLSSAVRHLESAGALVHLLDPPDLPGEYKTVTKLLQDAATATEETIGKLRKLKGIKQYHATVRRLAADAEFSRRLLLVRLTSGEVDPLDAVEIRAVSDELNAAVCSFLDVAEVVETVLITEG